MRRNIEEVKTEIEKRSAEHERRKKARMKSLAIGSGAALTLTLTLMLAIFTIPNMKGFSGGADHAPAAQNADSGIHGHSEIGEMDGTDGVDYSGGGNSNLMPPREVDYPQTGGAPHTGGENQTFPPEELPESTEAPINSGTDSNGNYTPPEDGAVFGMIDGSPALEWLDTLNGGYEYFKWSEIFPQVSLVLYPGADGNTIHEIWDEADTKALADAFFALVDSGRARKADPALDTEYVVRFSCEEYTLRCIKLNDGSFRVNDENAFTANPDTAAALDALVAALTAKHEPRK